ncbi:MAG: hypothetical protein ACRD8A_16260 [Candidatus Acidiferrales bacterium]
MNPYKTLLKNRSTVAKHFAANAFNGTTWRIFKAGEEPKIKKFLMREIGDGRRLARCSKAEYIKRLKGIIERFRSHFHMSRKMKHQPARFGYAAKVVNLYIKHLLLIPECLELRYVRTLETRAHVPLDKLVLARIWGDKRRRGHFRRELSHLSQQPPTLKALTSDDYCKIQSVLADAARKENIPPVAYDLYYSWRN